MNNLPALYSRQSAMIVTIEGVLFDIGHRRHLMPAHESEGSVTSPELRQAQWDHYWEAIDNDELVPAIAMIVDDMLAAGRFVVFSSGVPEEISWRLGAKLAQSLPSFVWAVSHKKAILITRPLNETYLDSTDRMVALLEHQQLDVKLAIVKNNGMSSILRKAYPDSVVINIAGAINARKTKQLQLAKRKAESNAE